MTSHSQGIHQLLQAEKRAKEKLEEAKKRKGRRLKQAKSEAQAEIDQYRLQREREFKHKQDSVRIDPNQMRFMPASGKSALGGGGDSNR
ncbi:V-type proton ATPase subunit G 3-like [Leucoraja erinacea]|uniref:V-type proton ATPase subunit G 3-like n=1 Tax=Leucoraja erinaceus TaxID=7782 RepID=UPI0024537694|nr:V-type proton ATPase subunit G 3-like [Leucoraja erinacea]